VRGLRPAKGNFPENFGKVFLSFLSGPQAFWDFEKMGIFRGFEA